jgi:hypothetical protein
MNPKHFTALADRYYKGFSDDRLEFLEKLTNLIQEYEDKSGEIVGATLNLAPHSNNSDEFNKAEIVWDGEVFRR